MDAAQLLQGNAAPLEYEHEGLEQVCLYAGPAALQTGISLSIKQLRCSCNLLTLRGC